MAVREILQPNTGDIKNIAHASSLARILGTNEEQLIAIAESVEDYWLPGAKKKKPDGSIRKTNNASKPLKDLHQAINVRLLRPCTYPAYLHGSLPGTSIRTNAAIHTHKSVVINEDIQNFFPSVTSYHIHRIWKYFFCCSEEISDILTRLTTYNGALAQGWKPSSYLANLVFWDTEPQLVKKINQLGFRYSRLTDDITISTSGNYSKQQAGRAIAEIHKFLRVNGFQMKRVKHSIRPKSSRQTVNNQLVNNRKVALPREKRKSIRAQVHALESLVRYGVDSTDLYNMKWRSACQRVGMLKHSHPNERERLRARLKAIKPVSC